MYECIINVKDWYSAIHEDYRHLFGKTALCLKQKKTKQKTQFEINYFIYTVNTE